MVRGTAVGHGRCLQVVRREFPRPRPSEADSGRRAGARRPNLRAAIRPVTVDDTRLHTLQKDTFTYFWSETNPANGLLPDNTFNEPPASIAGVGLALATYAVGVARGFVT